MKTLEQSGRGRGLIGSKLWLLKRSKIVDAGAREGATLTRFKLTLPKPSAIHRSEGLFEHHDQLLGRTGSKIYAQIVMYRGPKQLLSLQFAALWNELYPLQAQQRI